MRYRHNFRGMVLAMVTLVLVLPPTKFAVASQPPSRPAAALSPSGSEIGDVALGRGGRLQGQMVDPQGTAIPGVTVTISNREQELARTVTNQEGNFAFTGLRGGLYMVSAQGQHTLKRLWSESTAPPTARGGMLLVSHDSLAVRGQMIGGMLGAMGSNMATLLLTAGTGYLLYEAARDHGPAS